MIHSLTTAESEARHCSIWGLAQKMLFRGTHAHNLGCEETRWHWGLWPAFHFNISNLLLWKNLVKPHSLHCVWVLCFLGRKFIVHVRRREMYYEVLVWSWRSLHVIAFWGGCFALRCLIHFTTSKHSTFSILRYGMLPLKSPSIWYRVKGILWRIVM